MRAGHVKCSLSPIETVYMFLTCGCASSGVDRVAPWAAQAWRQR